MSGGRTGHRWVALLIPLVGLAWGCSPNAAGNTNPTSKTTGAPATSGTSGTTGAPATPASTANPVASAATVISATGSAPTLPAISSDVATSTTAVGVVVFAGSGDFYDVPTPLPSGRPGQVIRVQPVTDTRIVNALVLRVMYHSQDLAGADVAVTGIVAVPQGIGPHGGRPVISWGHGTVGMGPSCAPSRSDDADIDRLAQHFLDAGYVWAATDYKGLGPPGQRLAYQSGGTEGRSAIDIVRAAHNIPTADAGASWAMYGHSQGGHAALFAGQLAPTYAPELALVGTVAAAPSSDTSYLAVNADNGARAFLVMALLGLAADYPQLRPADYLTQKALDLAPIVDGGCLRDVYTAYKTLAPGETLIANPNEVEPAKTIFAANAPGQVKTAVPILIVHGTNDTTIPPETTKVLADQMCALGQVVERVTYDGETHATIIDAVTADVDHWLDDRFAGVPAPTSCP